MSFSLPNLIPRFALIVVALSGMAAQADEGPFVTLSFDDALAQAEKSHKAVFVDFFTTWCMPCRMLEQQTWKDKDVIAWLTDKTVALKLDAEKNRSLASRYGIDSYPTLLFLRPNGKEIDRITGFIEPKAFLTEAKGILSGKDALTRAKMKLEAAGANDPIARMQYGQVLSRLGKNAEALKAFLWCYDEGLDHGMGFGGVRLSFLLSDIADLGRRYPPARQALQARSDTARDQILAGTGTYLQAMEFEAINRCLDQPDAIVGLYDTLKSTHPDWKIVADLRREAFDQLRHLRRYTELYRDMEIAQSVDDAFAELHPKGLFNRLLRGLIIRNKQQREELDQAEKQIQTDKLYAYYEVLIGSGHDEEADQLADRLLKMDQRARIYNQLAWSGYLTGRPTETNLEQARQAYQLSEGHNVAIIDTYARILHARGQTSQAHQILHQALKQTQDPREQEILRTCLADVGGTVPGNELWKPALVGLGVVLLVFLVILRISRRSRPQPEQGEPFS